jgi:hypothetical protein
MVPENRNVNNMRTASRWNPALAASRFGHCGTRPAVMVQSNNGTLVAYSEDRPSVAAGARVRVMLHSYLSHRLRQKRR